MRTWKTWAMDFEWGDTFCVVPVYKLDKMYDNLFTVEIELRCSKNDVVERKKNLGIS